jgi:Ca2+:H+ antiporter
MQKIYWLFILVPITLAVRYLTSWNGTLTFLLAACAMIPLARLLGDATEQLSSRTGPTLGALLNITFGNAGELLLRLASRTAAISEGIDHRLNSRQPSRSLSPL